MLEWNVMNNCVEDKVKIFKAALFNVVGTLGMLFDPTDVGHTIVDYYGTHKNVVPTLMLDYFPPVWKEKVFLMKIDVEGFECKVLEGASSFMMSEYSPEVILFECFPYFLGVHGCSSTQLLQMVYDFGYVEMYAYNEFDNNIDFKTATQYEKDIVPNQKITPDMFSSYHSFAYREIRATRRKTNDYSNR